MRIGRREFLAALSAPLLRRMLPAKRPTLDGYTLGLDPSDGLGRSVIKIVVMKSRQVGMTSATNGILKHYKSVSFKGVDYPVNQVGDSIMVEFSGKITLGDSSFGRAPVFEIGGAGIETQSPSHWDVAQLVERRTLTPKAAGSWPAVPAKV